MQFPELSSYTVTKFPVIERYYRTHKLGELVHLNIKLILESLDTSIQKSETLGFLTAGHLVHQSERYCSMLQLEAILEQLYSSKQSQSIRESNILVCSSSGNLLTKKPNSFWNILKFLDNHSLLERAILQYAVAWGVCRTKFILEQLDISQQSSPIRASHILVCSSTGSLSTKKPIFFGIKYVNVPLSVKRIDISSFLI